MSILQTNTDIKDLQTILGIDGWQLSNCSLTSGDDTLTFLDISGYLSEIGIDINLGSVPIGQALADILNNPESILSRDSPDRQGDTFYISQTDSFKNIIKSKQRPNGTPYQFQWGSAEVNFTIVTLLSNQNYLNKLRYLKQVLTKNLNSDGAQLSHSLYGIYNNVFVNSFDISSSQEVFNGSLVTIHLTTTNDGLSTPASQSNVGKINSYINDLENILSYINSLNNIENQIQSLYPAAIQPNGRYQGSSSTLIKQDITYGDDSLSLASGVNVIIADNNLRKAIVDLTSSGLALDYSIGDNSNTIMDQCCQLAGVVIQGFGTGIDITTQTNSITDTNIDKYTESTQVVGDDTINIRYNIDSFDGTNYHITEVITTSTSIPKPVSALRLRNKVNEIITVSKVYSSIYPDDYANFVGLISNLERLTELAISSITANTVILKENKLIDMVALENNTTVDNILKNNKNLYAHKKLLKGMEITIYEEFK